MGLVSEMSYRKGLKDRMQAARNSCCRKCVGAVTEMCDFFVIHLTGFQSFIHQTSIEEGAPVSQDRAKMGPCFE